MIGAWVILLLFQLVGEIIVQMSDLPAPGPVIGMVLLFLALKWRGVLPATLRTTAETLLSHLSLLFIPAGVGIIQYGALLRDEWFALTVALIISTLLTVTVTALVMRAILQRRASNHSSE
jgi:holin-like protein